MEIKNWPLYPATIAGLGLRDPGNAHPDRDPRQGGDPDLPQQAKLDRDLTEEEFAEIMKKLGVILGTSGLGTRVEKDARGKRVVLIIDTAQTVVRRLTEQDLAASFLFQDRGGKGGLLNKAA